MTEFITAVVFFIGGGVLVAWRLRAGRPLVDLAKAIIKGVVP